MGFLVAILAAAAAQLSVDDIVLAPKDFLDGRAIAAGTGAPVVMLTLTKSATARVIKVGRTATVRINGTVATARQVDNTIEIDGQTSFEAARKLALDISGKPPLPDSLDE